MDKKIVLLVSESGGGKSSIAKYCEKQYGLKELKSYTTRPPRFNGENTHTFISDEEFDGLTDIVAYTEFDGHRYCSTKQQIENCDIYTVDPDGVEYLKAHYTGDAKFVVVYLQVSEKERFERMARTRGEESAQKRIEHDKHAFRDAMKIADCCYLNEGQEAVSFIAGEINRIVNG